MIKKDLSFQIAFGKNLKKLREERNWTQMDLAVVSGLNETQISKIENGEYGPNLNSLRLLCNALGVYPKELFEFDYKFTFNHDFSSRGGRRRKPGPTAVIKQMIDDNFFASGKSVAEIVKRCKVKYQLDVKSSDVSGALLKLVRLRVLRKTASGVTGKHLYINK